MFQCGRKNEISYPVTSHNEPYIVISHDPKRPLQLTLYGLSNFWFKSDIWALYLMMSTKNFSIKLVPSFWQNLKWYEINAFHIFDSPGYLSWWTINGEGTFSEFRITIFGVFKISLLNNQCMSTNVIFSRRRSSHDLSGWLLQDSWTF